MNYGLSKCGVATALLVLACGHASGARAASNTDVATPSLPAFLNAGRAAQAAIRCASVGDDVLAHQSGKYAGSDMISGFVLTVLSQWQLPNGATALAQGALTVAQNAVNQLSAQVRTAASITGASHGASNQNTGATPGAIVTGGQGVSVNGIAQITQVAGDGNVGANSTTIGYGNTSLTPAIAGATNGSSAFASNANGSITAAITFANNSVNVAIRTPAGLAAQSISPTNAGQAGAIAQLLQIAGNSQKVSNQLGLTLQTQPMTGTSIRQTGVLQALRNVH